MPDTTLPRAPLWRRLAAMVYDGLLLIAVLLVATALMTAFTRGQAVEPGNPLMTTYLFLVCFFFFGWFWTHGGQTLGMRAWRLRLQRTDGAPLSWWHALLRFVTALPAWTLLLLGIVAAVLDDYTLLPGPVRALFGVPSEVLLSLGVLWVLWDNSRLSWRDRFTETQVVVLPKG